VLNGAHPDLWSFINILKTTQNSRDLNVQHVISGFKPAKKRAKYLEADNRIFNLVSSFDNNSDVLEYLKGISNNCKLE